MNSYETIGNTQDIELNLFELKLKLKEVKKERMKRHKESSKIKNRINLLKGEEVKVIALNIKVDMEKN